ncbi:MAG: hypothetical protein M1816_000087 [Peltula sp. TS41687]|nr:MAG: hypothetical protein M1816_000087 [Peltula sp. TS41687]
MPAASMVDDDSQLATATQLLDKLESVGVAYAEAFLRAHEALAQSLALRGQSAGYNGTTDMDEIEDSPETDSDCTNPTDLPNSIPLTLPEQEYTDHHLTAFTRRGRYGPWAEDLLGPLLPKGDRSGDETFPWKADSGHPSPGSIEMDVVHDYDGRGPQTSGLAAGAGDREFWQYIRTMKPLNVIHDYDVWGSQCSGLAAGSGDKEFWEYIRTIKPVPSEAQGSSEPRRPGGRLIKVRSLSSTVTRALVVALERHFDMDQLLTTFLYLDTMGSVSPTRYDDTRKGVWRFNIQSYKITSRKWGYDRLFPWIKRGPTHDTDSDTMICRYHSLVALTFTDSRSSPPSVAPWLVLTLSAPNSTIWPVKDHYVDGHEAFLSALELEIHDACEGVGLASRMIGYVAMPPKDFLFSEQTRDHLLFEDNSFSLSRKYFWAFQASRAINHSIESIIHEWKRYRKRTIDEGVGWTTHMAMTSDQTTTASEHRRRITQVVGRIEDKISELEELLEFNRKRQDEIIASRDGLFSASQVIESRLARSQSENIRLLTI